MCGIVAMIAKKDNGFNWKDKSMFRQMLLANTVRGDDSTGVFGVNKYGNLKMMKNAKPAQYMLDTKAYKEFEDDIFTNMRFVVGHNRASTRGATIDENAHPFIQDHICLIHNGTLTSHRHLANVDVDSHAICKAFAEKGHKAVFPEIYGAFALIWYDALEKRLYLGRNKERPLWLVDTDDAIYIASEPEMLIWLYRRTYNKACKPCYLMEDKLYHWDLGQKAKIFTYEDIPAKKALPVVAKVITPPFNKKQEQQSQLLPNNWSLPGQSSNHSSSSGKHKVGEKIIFEHSTNSINGSIVYIRGITLDQKYKVSGMLDTTNMNPDQIEELLDTTDYFSATVKGDSKKLNSNYLVVSDIKAEPAYNTVNGDVIFTHEIQEAGWCCHECGTFIDPDEDDGKFWARIKNGSVKKLLCPTCVDSNPNLKALSCTNSNESSSSHTNHSADPLNDYETFSEGAACNFLH